MIPPKCLKAMKIESKWMQRYISFVKLHSWIYSRAASLKWRRVRSASQMCLVIMSFFSSSSEPNEIQMISLSVPYCRFCSEDVRTWKPKCCSLPLVCISCLQPASVTVKSWFVSHVSSRCIKVSPQLEDLLLVFLSSTFSVKCNDRPCMSYATAAGTIRQQVYSKWEPSGLAPHKHED